MENLETYLKRRTQQAVNDLETTVAPFTGA